MIVGPHNRDGKDGKSSAIGRSIYYLFRRVLCRTLHMLFKRLHKARFNVFCHLTRETTGFPLNVSLTL
ncbi:hypothetical protein BT96DRAFT_917356 [Gymnopus androsaceus JB14]|uniref:Uncharacterized protein n=1 Tax=Gymnopus androsaceus JB14 TaxID=1447944 RepID=A0A6A4GAD3_9AGAR|nr:hypothetical protein BT96DRAFT_930278 [Gymnopus androsaceus JB14]KAE9403810.1 hypothetical protein BT96DRAFT_917356 [Gymnopus androsaceus JB14]